MKVKIKLSIEQFKFLLKYIDAAIYQKILFLNELQLLNLRAFLTSGFKKLIDLNTALMFTPAKVKTFTIEINQFHAVLTVLQHQFEFLDSYTLSIFEDLKRQNKTFYTIGLNY
jgi:hypothetical protein